MSGSEVNELAAELTGLRLLSEAELEWVMREGGLSFSDDGARIYTAISRWPRQSGWGIEGLTQNTWVADESHDNYRGAPSS